MHAIGTRTACALKGVDGLVVLNAGMRGPHGHYLFLGKLNGGIDDGGFGEQACGQMLGLDGWFSSRGFESFCIVFPCFSLVLRKACVLGIFGPAGFEVNALAARSF